MPWYRLFFYVWTGRSGATHFVIMPMGYIALAVIAGAIIVAIAMHR